MSNYIESIEEVNVPKNPIAFAMGVSELYWYSFCDKIHLKAVGKGCSSFMNEKENRWHQRFQNSEKAYSQLNAITQVYNDLGAKL